ncbi:uncharacterized protein TRUGW13939_01074 [Talaromyces rugulosus]|uniref:Probable E3 ubiquitin ligase complex SCF subunit sconB n=1 Tax=Talaromyces rugulosus TaxID=121627 RepID=A0A7H8QJY8_TALRU|nr:uncharacterized protein TRUGW13939_01074 [Talaromyces rugulosus]QKX53992.1 hypothetical protein TRUGW13939_01074 [Talaromyces rugulosus]
MASQGSNRSFCNRHRPDLPRQRLADEASIEETRRELKGLPPSSQQAIDSTWIFFSNASEKERNLIIDGILAKCCFSQLSHISTSIKALIRIDFFTVLPTEISYRILQYLDATTLCKAAQVSKLWKKLADDDVLWHRMCQQHINKKCTRCGWSLPMLQKKQQRPLKWSTENSNSSNSNLEDWGASLGGVDELKTEVNVSCGHDDASANPPTKRRRTISHQANTSYARPWKEVYKERLMVGLNWRHGRYKTTIFKGHSDSVMCLQIRGNLLVTGSYDASIKLWNLNSGTLIRAFLGHAAGIRALQFGDNKIISGSLDQTIKIWNWQTGQCVLTISNHNNALVGLDLVGNILASGSMDRTIKIWNFEDKESFTLCGHKDGVNSVQFDTTSHTLISASDDFTMRLWDLDTRQCIRVFEGHCGQVQQALFSPPEIEYDHLPEPDALASNFTQKDMESIRSSYGEGFSGHPERPLPPLYVISGSLDNTLRLWNTASGACVRVDFGHTEGVWAIAMDHLRVVSGAGDFLTKVWDAVTGDCVRTLDGHTGPVTCLGLTDSIIATGSDDCQVIVYDFTPQEIAGS